MFTVKLFRGLNNELIDVFEAHSVRIQKRNHIDQMPDVAIILDSGRPSEFWHYVTNEPNDWHYRMGVVENMAGKTTEVIHP